MELDNNINNNNNQSANSSPIASPHRRLQPSFSESSAVLMDRSPSLHAPEIIQPHPHLHRPTIEQNMAFAALQQSQQELNMNTTTNPADRPSRSLTNKRI